MKPCRLFWPNVLLALSLSLPAAAAEISDYHPFVAPCRVDGTLVASLRALRYDGIPSLLVIDPTTVKTRLVPAAAVSCDAPGDAELLAATPYGKGLRTLTAEPVALHNGGLRHGTVDKGLFLTVDLCPSRHRELDRPLFIALRKLPQALHGPVPVAVAISGRWLETHPSEVSWLKGEEEQGRLAITWVNHSLTHPYQPGINDQDNFLLTKGVNLAEEVLATERLMLTNELLPSPFFRFPGLVADQRLMAELKTLGLMPLGSDAWLAKGEEPKSGSIILVHGNGNEPAGVLRFLSLVDKKGGELTLLPLNHAITADK
jgi:hypothetical protein